MPETWRGGADYDYLMGRWSRVLAPKFLEWAGVPSGVDVLDVGCGTGSLSNAILSRGPKSVVGIDASPAYVAYAAAKIGRKQDISFEVGNAMDLPFSDNSFGAVVSSLMLNFAPDPARVVQEMSRVIRTGGLVAACVWDYAGKMEMLRAFWDAAASVRPDAKEKDEGGRSPICNPGRLADLFHGAGLIRVETGSVDVPMTFANFEDYWNPFLGGQGPAGSYAMSLNERDREDLRELLRSRLARQSDGSIALTSRAWAVRGNK